MAEEASLTIDVDQTRLLQLTRAAEEEEIAIEKLLRDILQLYLSWRIVSEEAEFSALPKSAVRALLENLSDRQIEELAITKAYDFRDIILQTYGRIDLDLILSLIEERARRSCFMLRQFVDDVLHGILQSDDDERRFFKTLFVEHNMGIKWSFFFKEHRERMFKNLGYSFKSEYTKD
jgi:uncharacterized protein YutE (UPF0331/DUF86 family)